MEITISRNHDGESLIIIDNEVKAKVKDIAGFEFVQLEVARNIASEVNKKSRHDEVVKAQNFPNGLAVKELKQLIKTWPEKDEYGEDCQVWIDTNGLSNECKSVSPLNLRKNKSGFSADIIFE